MMVPKMLSAGIDTKEGTTTHGHDLVSELGSCNHSVKIAAQRMTSQRTTQKKLGGGVKLAKLFACRI